MKKKFFVLAAAIISIQLQAQQDTTLLDEAVITANKYPGKTSTTGKVVTVITREQLEQSGGKDLSQLLTEQAGIFIAGANSNTGKDKSIYLRGARVEHTLVMVDGVPLYDPSGIGSNFDIRNLSVSQIERIEILKGSQSTLYGSDAIAGVIHIITRKTGTQKLAGTLQAGYGSFETLRTHAAIRGSQQKFSYDLSLSLHDTRGINETTDRNGNQPVDRDGYTQQAVQAGMTYRPSEKISIRPFFRLTDIRGGIDQGAFTDELDYTYTQRSRQAGVGSEISLGKARLHLLYSYNSIRRLYTDDSTQSRNGFDTWSEGMYKGAEHFADLYITMQLPKGWKLVGGADLRSSRSDQSYASVGFFGPYSTQYSNDSLRQRQLGFYGALNWNHSSGFNTELGGRLNIHNTWGSYAVFNLNPSYWLQKRWKFFANLSSGYRTPSLYQLFSEYGNRDLQPEKALSLEGGLQYFAKNNRFTGRAVAFSRKVKEVIFFYYNSSTFTSQYINQDRQDDHGLELEAVYHFSPRVNARAFYTYVTGEIQTLTGGKDTSYNNLLRRPRSSGGLQLRASVNDRFHISSSLQLTGERKDAYYDNTLFQTVYSSLGAYALWDLYAEYGFFRNRLKLYADLRNISNSRYTEISGFNTPGFNGSGGIRFNF